jgi:hypothetical protein
MDPLQYRTKPVRRRKRRKPLSEEIRTMTRVLSITLILLGTFAAGMNLYTNGKSSTQGYNLKQLQIEHERLQSDLQKIEHEVMEAQSFQSIEEHSELNTMKESNDSETSYVDESPIAQNE